MTGVHKLPQMKFIHTILYNFNQLGGRRLTGNGGLDAPQETRKEGSLTELARDSFVINPNRLCILLDSFVIDPNRLCIPQFRPGGIQIYNFCSWRYIPPDTP